MNLTTGKDSVVIDSVYFSAQTFGGYKRKFVVDSEVIDISLSGDVWSKKLLPSIYSLLQDVMPSWYIEEYADGDLEELNLDVSFKKTDNVLNIFAPGLRISEGTHLSGTFSPVDKKFIVGGYSDSIQLNGVKLYALKMTAERSEDRAYLMFENEKTSVSDKIGFKNNIYTAYMYNDSLESDLTWTTTGLNSSGFFSTLTVFNDRTSGVVNFLPSDIIINKEYWSIKEEYPVFFNPEEIDITNFTIEKGLEQFVLQGQVSKNPKRKIKC